jgi:hypothetical protein
MDRTTPFGPAWLLALLAMVGWAGCDRAPEGGSANRDGGGDASDDGGDYSDESGEQDPTDDMGGDDGGDPGDEGTPDPLPQPPALPSFCKTLSKTGDWVSTRVSYGSDGKLKYTADGEKNRIVDFSYAGYRYGEVDLPQVAEVATLAPTSGDQTARIQKALDEVGARTPDANGFRGALLLAPGHYEINGTVRVRQSGVVLRGSGDGGDPAHDTILVARGDSPHQRTVVIAGSGNSQPWKRGSGTEVTDAFVQVGSKSVNVKDPSLFKVGDRVIVNHPSTQAWLDSIDGGGTGSDPKWSAGSMDIPYYRSITRIEGTRLTFDAPIYSHLNQATATASVYKASGGPIFRVAVESLRVDIETLGGEDENHAWDAIGVVGAEDAWVRGVTVLHFGHAGVFTSGARRVTVADSRAREPVGIRTGGRFYNFDAEGNSQLILIKNVEAKGGRHNFISNGVQTSSGLVFYRSTSDGGDNEGHRHWTQAMLFDNVTDAGTVRLHNRRDWGTSHGWGAVHSVIWNDQGKMFVQKPPTGQNYAISSTGRLGTGPFGSADGFIEIKTTGKLAPQSLYEAQLCERLSP